MTQSSLEAVLQWARELGKYPDSKEYKLALSLSHPTARGRLTLSTIARARTLQTFIATIVGRGSNGKRRTVLLKDLRIFGIKFFREDHLWVLYDKRWCAIEPFFQGERVVLVGTAMKYTRKDSTQDYTLELERVVKL